MSCGTQSRRTLGHPWVVLNALLPAYPIFFFIGQNLLGQLKQSACGAAFRSFSKPFPANFISSGRISSVVRPWDLAVAMIEHTCLTTQGGNSLVTLWFLSKNR